MSGANNNDAASSWVNQCQTIELLEKQAIVKALRAISGQFQVGTYRTGASGTTFVQDPEFNFPIKGGKNYIVEGYFLISAISAAGLQLQFNLPNNSSGVTFVGKVTTAAAGTVATVTLNGSASLNTPIINAAAAYDTVYIQGLLNAPIDDILTVSFAQNTSNVTTTNILGGSNLNVIRLSSSRRAPNVV